MADRTNTGREPNKADSRAGVEEEIIKGIVRGYPPGLQKGKYKEKPRKKMDKDPLSRSKVLKDSKKSSKKVKKND